MSKPRSIQIAFYALGIVTAARSAHAATFTVNSNNDANDGLCDAAHCSFREALIASNATPAVTDTIAFAIGSGIQTITPLAANGPLPYVDYPVTIDGSTQPGWAGTPLIEINGASATGTNCNGSLLCLCTKHLRCSRSAEHASA